MFSFLIKIFKVFYIKKNFKTKGFILVNTILFIMIISNIIVQCNDKRLQNYNTTLYNYDAIKSYSLGIGAMNIALVIIQGNKIIQDKFMNFYPKSQSNYINYTFIELLNKENFFLKYIKSDEFEKIKFHKTIKIHIEDEESKFPICIKNKNTSHQNNSSFFFNFLQNYKIYNLDLKVLAIFIPNLLCMQHKEYKKHSFLLLNTFKNNNYIQLNNILNDISIYNKNRKINLSTSKLSVLYTFIKFCNYSNNVITKKNIHQLRKYSIIFGQSMIDNFLTILNKKINNFDFTKCSNMLTRTSKIFTIKIISKINNSEFKLKFIIKQKLNDQILYYFLINNIILTL